jgi:hypothetical protein
MDVRKCLSRHLTLILCRILALEFGQLRIMESQSYVMTLLAIRSARSRPLNSADQYVVLHLHAVARRMIWLRRAVLGRCDAVLCAADSSSSKPLRTASKRAYIGQWSLG